MPQQVLFGGCRRSDPSQAVDTYVGLQGSQSVFLGVEDGRTQIITSPGKISKLKFTVATAPGTDNSWVFTLRVNGEDSALTCTIAGSATSAEDASSKVNVSAGDRVSIKVHPVSSPADSEGMRWRTLFTGTNIKECLVMSCSDNTLSTATTEYRDPMTGYAYHDDDVDVYGYVVIPTAGTLKNLYVRLDDSPGAGKSYTFCLFVEGEATALTCAIADDATTGEDTGNPIAVSKGARVAIRIVPSGTPTARYCSTGLTFVTDGDDGNSVILNNSRLQPATDATQFICLAGVDVYNTVWSAVEATNQQLGLACTLKKLYIYLSTAPGADKAWDFTLRVGGVSKALTVHIAGTDTTGEDAVNEVAINDDDLVALETAPDSAPAATYVKWSLESYAVEAPPPPTVEVTTPFRLDPKPRTRMKFYPSLRLG